MRDAGAAEQTQGGAAPPSSADSADGRGIQLQALGTEIRKLRKQRGMSLKELSDSTSLSAGFLSLVERGRSSLALTSLFAVATALDIDVHQLFAQLPSVGRAHALPQVTRSGEDGRGIIKAGERVYNLLSVPQADRVLEPLRVQVPPTDTPEPPQVHDGEEFAYVLSGELVYVVQGVEYRLGEGDSIHVLSTVPHQIRNDTNDGVTVLYVVTPRMT